MKVLLINGSPRREGNTYLALSEVSARLAKHNIDSEIVQLGTKPVRGCVACYKCKAKGEGCVCDDDLCNRINEKMATCDALIVGAPVYYGQPNGAAMTLVQRMFMSAGKLYKGKPAAAIAVCRRGGATAAFQTMNMPFMMMNMPVVTSQYWNIVYGRNEGEAVQDVEGLQTMRTLADNMAWMLKNIHGEHTAQPEREPWEPMNFIR